MSFLSKRYFVGLSISMVCFIAIVTSSPAWSGKLYKWVDKNGQTHYSQIPPQKNQLKDPKAVKEKSAGSSIPVNRKGDYAYCGDMKLPGPLYEPKRMLLGLGDRAVSWRKSLRQSEESLTSQLRRLGDKTRRNQKYSSRSSTNISYIDSASKERKQTARRIKEYRCAIAWADRQKTKYSDVKQEVAHDLKGAKVNYQAALDAAHQDCGFEPKDYANAKYNAKKSAWKKCMRPHDRKISAGQRNLGKLRKQANKLD